MIVMLKTFALIIKGLYLNKTYFFDLPYEVYIVFYTNLLVKYMNFPLSFAK